MLLCRRLHFKIQIHKALITASFCSHTPLYHPDYLVAAPDESKRRLVDGTINHVDVGREGHRHSVKHLFVQVHNDTQQSFIDRKPLNSNDASVSARILSRSRGSVSIYIGIRKQSRAQLDSLSPAVFIHVFRQAFREKLHYVVDCLIADTGEVFQDEPGNLMIVLVAFLKILCQRPDGQLRRIFTVFKCLPDGCDHNSMPQEVVIQVAKAIMLQPHSDYIQFLPFVENAV